MKSGQISALVEWSKLNPHVVRRYQRLAQACTGIFIILFTYSLGKNPLWLYYDGVRTQGTIIRSQEIRTPARGLVGCRSGTSHCDIHYVGRSLSRQFLLVMALEGQ